MNGLDGAGLVDIKGTGGVTGHNCEASRRLLVVWSAAALNQPEPMRIGVFCWEVYTTSTARGHLAEPVRVAGQGVAHAARHPIVSVGFW